MERFSSLSFAPAETRRALRSRFERFLGSRSISMARGGEVVLADEDMLRLLQDLHIDFASNIDHARAIFETASAEIPDHPDLETLIADGWMRIVWSRISAPLAIAREIGAAGSITGLKALMARRHDEAFRFSSAMSEDSQLAVLAQQMAEAKRLPAGTMCQTPEWVAARLWDRAYAGSADLVAALRLWTDRCNVLGAPDLVPSRAWAPAAADAFRRTAIDVLESIAGLPDWDRTREYIIASLALAGSQPRANIERYILPVPPTVTGRALWLLDHRLERLTMESLDASGAAARVMWLLLADVEFQELSPAPNPLAARLLPVIADRPDLLFAFLFSIERHPRLLADLLFCPETSVLACVLIARWQGPGGAWDKELRLRDFQSAKACAFADSVSIMGHFLKEGTVSSAEVAVLLEWLHAQSREIRHPGGASAVALLTALQGEVTSQPENVLNGIVAALMDSVPPPAAQTPAFAAALDIIDLGHLTATVPPEPFVSAYTDSIASGGYGLTVERITPRAANALYGLTLRGSEDARRNFFYPLHIKERLATSTEQNSYILAADIARSIRAHIRVLCRIVAGHDDVPGEELLAALVAALRAGAIEHKEKGRIAAFAPREESSYSLKAQDRPLAADIGEALNTLQGDDRERVLGAVLETDEPLILAQLFPLVSTAAQERIEARIAALSPSEAGEIHSLTEVQARIDQLLAAGLPESAARFMEDERSQTTLGNIPERALTQLQAELRLMLLRSNWEGLAVIQVPADLTNHLASRAADAIAFYRAVAQMKKPGGDLAGAAEIFSQLAHRRPDVPAYKVNLFATRIGMLLGSNGFATVSGADLAQGRHLLSDAEALAATVDSSADAEIISINRGLLLLALRQPEAALPVLASVRNETFRAAVAAYSAVALARLGREDEAQATLQTAENRFGKLEVLRAARDYLTSGAAFSAFTAPALEDDPVPRIKNALHDFRQMDHERQAQVLNPEARPFVELVIGHVRAAAETVVNLVPMMKDVTINACEDDLTGFIQHIIAARIAFLGWTVADQGRGGFTARENPGEKDLTINKGTTTLTVVEAVVCDRPVTHQWARGELTSHFQKLLAYATCALFFHLTYAYTGNPGAIADHLRAAAQNDKPEGFTFLDCEDIPFTDTRPTGFIARYKGEFGEVRVVFLILDLGQHHQKAAAKLADRTNPRKQKKDST